MTNFTLIDVQPVRQPPGAPQGAVLPSLTHGVAIVAAFALLFMWLFARPVLIDHGYINESDLYEFGIPKFLARATTWSSFEFGGMPAFADPGESQLYPLH